ncbi:MAG: hypothetical protein SFY92_09095 [Verrucomicrobiae bacterium]|nr:hypothetical protein [Verrucomicrobiae bacterium]
MSNDTIQKISDQADKAFDFRGDVTVDLVNGSKLEGFLSNRDNKARTIEMYLAGEKDIRVVNYSEIAEIRITGEDMAAGKSWEDWQAKREREKQKGVDRAARREAEEHPGQHRDIKVF